ncbi:MAG: hypothetical protein AAF413_03110 [Patescibacteria group bacterium]
MKKLNQKGLVDVYAILFGMSTLLLLGAVVFSVWAFMERADYKNNVDEKIAQATEVALEDQKIQLEAEAAEKAKSPYDEYTTPADFGSVKIVYPRTWSAFIDEELSGNTPIDAYFNPNFVPGSSAKASLALRFQVSGRSADQILSSYQSSINSGKVTAKAYEPQNVSGAKSGWRIDGEIVSNKQGALIILPLRDKTISIWTEDRSFIPDLEKAVLENLTYIP